MKNSIAILLLTALAISQCNGQAAPRPTRDPSQLPVRPPVNQPRPPAAGTQPRPPVNAPIRPPAVSPPRAPINQPVSFILKSSPRKVS